MVLLVLKKRIIGVVNVKDGIAVQSFGFNKYLPLGKPECFVENLDRWGADEILLNVMDLSSKGLGPNLALLEKVANLGIETPLIYSGGISSVKDGKDVIGDFIISKEGKVDLTGLKAGKYSAKIKIGSDETLLSKVKSSINIDDVMSIINHIGKVKFLSDKEIVAGNITRPETNDDKVDIDDVMSILKIIGGG